VRPANEAALAMYDGLGFEKIGIRRGYYSDTREDAVVMLREFHAGRGMSVAR